MKHPKNLKPETKRIICPTCGKEWHYEDAKYCGMCGEKLKDIGYTVKSNNPNCGRDANGVFHCACGKCEELMPNIDHDCDHCGDDCKNGGDNGNCRIELR